MPISKAAKKAQADYQLLATHYPDAHCALNYNNPWELLVATILSAQCTDVRVNLVTPELFKRFPQPRFLAAAAQEDVEELIRSTGFFRNKAKNLIACATQLDQHHAGSVPAKLEALVALPGVGRKTANVVLGNAFGIPGMVVDTHIGRIAYRLGWTKQKDPVKVEKELCKLLPPKDWTMCAHVLIAHGRVICKAPTPWCSRCFMVEGCRQVGVVRMK